MQILGVIMLVLCAGVAPAVDALDERDASSFPKLEKLLESKHWSGADVDKLVKEYRDAPVPFLLDRFEHEEDLHAKGKTAYFLGAFGVTEAAPKIMDFVKATARGEMTQDQAAGVKTALWGLAARGRTPVF